MRTSLSFGMYKGANMNNVIIVPSKPKGLDFFLKNHYWENLRLNKDKLNSLEYIAIYQSFPICKITHYGKITTFEEYEINSYRDKKRYRVHFNLINKHLNIFLEKETERKNIIQSIRYTNIHNLLTSSTLSKLFK